MAFLTFFFVIFIMFTYGRKLAKIGTGRRGRESENTGTKRVKTKGYL